MNEQTGSPSNGGEGLKYKKGSSDGKKHIENKAAGAAINGSSHMLLGERRRHEPFIIRRDGLVLVSELSESFGIYYHS
jgi:hypothetical protein